jgi:hypothetical protein
MEDTLAFKLTPKLPQSFTGQKMNTSKTKALNYMTNVLPQLDVDVLSAALDEANGDPMLAITLAVSQTKQKSKNEHFLTSHR